MGRKYRKCTTWLLKENDVLANATTVGLAQIFQSIRLISCMTSGSVENDWTWFWENYWSSRHIQIAISNRAQKKCLNFYHANYPQKMNHSVNRIKFCRVICQNITLLSNALAHSMLFLLFIYVFIFFWSTNHLATKCFRPRAVPRQIEPHRLLP